MALQTIDAVLSAASQWVSQGDPVLDRIHDVISVENIELGEPIRANELLIVVDQIYFALDAVKSKAFDRVIKLERRAHARM